MECYRVWMKDGYAGLYDAQDEADAKAQAIKAASEDKSWRDPDKSTKVARVEKL